MVNLKTRSNLVIGVLLLLIGSWFLIVQFIPSLSIWFENIFSWPVYIIGAGIFFFIFGLILGEPGLLVPGSILGGIGGLLFYQNTTGNWGSWSYAWALIPGFVGIGIILMTLFAKGGKGGYRAGLTLVFISLILFMIFGSFFGASPLGKYWPILLIALGVWILIRQFLKK